MVTEAFRGHREAVDALEAQRDTLLAVGRAITQALRSGGKVLAFGNGGSAADAQHLAAELVGRFTRERGALPAIALTTNTSILTAIGNDYGYEKVFVRQVEALGRPGDVAVGISTSGRSPNVLVALRRARELGLSTVGLAGAQGGDLPGVADFCIRVGSSTPRSQEAHILAIHIICQLVEEALAEAGPIDIPAAGEQRKEGTKVQGIPAPLQAVVFDFDGVFTDNRVLVHQDGSEAVLCTRADSLGLDRLKALGIPLLVLSTETNPVVAARCRKLGLECLQGCQDKAAALREYLRQRGLNPRQVVYVGNDVNDLECLRLVGCGVAVADASPEVAAAATVVLTSKGGHGAVRELCDTIIKGLATGQAQPR